MTAKATPSQEYLKNAVMTATPERLQLMLYDGAIRFAAQGLEALRNKDREGAFNALERAQRIVLELGNGLRREVNPELADQMAALYSFIYRRLVDANMQQDEQAIDDALSILRHQRETWLMLMEKLHKVAGEPATPQSATPPTPTEPAPNPPTADPSPDAPKSSFVAEG